MSRFYDSAAQWSLYLQYRGGKTLTQLCDETGITDKPLRAWFLKFDASCAQIRSRTPKLLHQENRMRRRQLQRIGTELEILQQTALLKSIPELRRITCVKGLLERYGINQICHTLQIRKSNFYYQTCRKPPKTVYEQRNEELRPILKSLCQSRTRRPGAEVLCNQMKDLGYPVGKKKVLELLRELEHRPPAGKRRQFTRTDASNLLARQFSPPKPNSVWVGDITEIPTDAGTLYLCVVMDLFSRKIVGARLSVRKEASLVCQTFLDAYHLRGCPQGLLFHSDQGSQYTAAAFRTLLESCSVSQSFSAPGVPYDNAPMESFFARLKTEELHRYRYRGMADLLESLRSYLSFYHRIRPHGGIGNRTPDQVENEYIEIKNAACRCSGCVPLA